MDITKYFKGVPDDGTKVNAAVCSACGGLCCKHMSCHVAPSDFIKVTKDIIKKGIDEGLFCMDWYDGHPLEEEGNSSLFFKAYYLRIRHDNSKALDASIGEKGSKCIFLKEDGCALPFGLRPKGARELIPKCGDSECESCYPKKQCAIDWLPYHDMMEELYNEYKAKGNYSSNMATTLEMIKDVFAPLLREEGGYEEG